MLEQVTPVYMEMSATYDKDVVERSILDHIQEAYQQIVIYSIGD